MATNCFATPAPGKSTATCSIVGLANGTAYQVTGFSGSPLGNSPVTAAVAATPVPVPVAGDISESATAAEIMRVAVDDLGGLDIVVSNAGITRDGMLFNLTDEQWDSVVRVHLRGHFLLNRNAAAHWRAASKAAVIAT